MVDKMVPLIFASLLLIGGGSVQAAESAPEKNFTMVHIQSSAEELPAVIKAEVPKAKRLRRRLFVYFSAEWCGPCRSLRNSLGDPLMIDAFNGTYIIQLDVDEWKEKLAGTGFIIRSIPAFFEVSNEGKPTGHTIDGGAWGENTPENMVPPLKAFFKGSSQKKSDRKG
jgi:thiol-disulfide isomerase/thioredoxin